MQFLALEPVRLLLYLVGICAFIGFNAAYLVLMERKVAGRMQRRPGPNEAGYGGWMQPFADVLKLFAKQIMIPPGVDVLLYCTAPLMVMAPPLIWTQDQFDEAEEAIGRALDLTLDDVAVELAA